jgi:predicted secreted protein
MLPNDIDIPTLEEAVKIMIAVSIANGNATKGYRAERDQTDNDIYRLKDILLKKIVKRLGKKYSYFNNYIIYFIDRNGKQISFHVRNWDGEWKQQLEYMNVQSIKWDEVKNSAYYISSLPIYNTNRADCINYQLRVINKAKDQLCQTIIELQNERYIENYNENGECIKHGDYTFYSGATYNNATTKNVARESLTQEQLKEVNTCKFDLLKTSDFLVLIELSEKFGKKYGIRKLLKKTKDEGIEKYKEIIMQQPVDYDYIKFHPAYIAKFNELKEIGEQQAERYKQLFKKLVALDKKEKKLNDELFKATHNLIEAQDWREVFSL